MTQPDPMIEEMVAQLADLIHGDPNVAQSVGDRLAAVYAASKARVEQDGNLAAVAEERAAQLEAELEVTRAELTEALAQVAHLKGEIKYLTTGEENAS